MTYFTRMSAVLGQNVTFTTQKVEICSAKVTNDKCQYGGNKRSQSDLSVNIRDIKPLNGADMTHYREPIASAIPHKTQEKAELRSDNRQPISNYPRKQDLSASFLALRKGQRVTLKSGKVLVVDGFSDNFFWAGKESLPYFRGDIV